MKNLLVYLLLIAGQIAVAQERKIAAILVSNSSYSGPSFQSLSFPVNDLQRMHYLLTDLKIDSSLILETTRVKTADEFYSFIEGCKRELAAKKVTDVIFYYSGHGVINSGESFLIPGEYNDRNYTSLYTGYNDHLKNYLTKLDQPTNDFEKEFSEKLQSLSLIKKTVAVSSLGERLKDFHLLLLSDACRKQLPAVSKSAISTINLDTYLKDWIKDNGNPNNQKKQAFYTAFKEFYAAVEDSLKTFDRRYEEFRNTLTDISARKPVTLFFGTNYYNSAVELSTLYSGAFTSVLDSVIRNHKLPSIRFNDDLNTIVRNSIHSATQKPVIEGWRNFEITNPFMREQPLTPENLVRITTDKTYRAVKLLVIKNNVEDNKNYLNTRKQVVRYFDKSQVSEWEDFTSLLQDSSLVCDKLRMDVLVRTNTLSLSFENGNASLLYGQEESIVPSYIYQFDKGSCKFTIPPDADLASASRNLRKLNREYDSESPFEIIDNTTFKLNSELAIAGFGNFSELVIKRISPNFDTLYARLPEMSSDATIELVLVATKNNRKIFTGSKIPYKGELAGKSVLLNSFLGNNSYQPNNVTIPAKWRNGIYTATLKMKVETDSSIVSATSNNSSSEFIRLHVNDVSRCANPTAPLSKGNNCNVAVNSASFSLTQLMQEKENLELTVRFEILDTDPSSLKLAIPFSFSQPELIRSVMVHSLIIEVVEEFTTAKSNRLLDSLKAEKEKKLKELQQQALQQKRAIANTERQKELRNYRIEKYAELYRGWKMEFVNSNSWSFNHRFEGREYQLLSAREGFNQLEIMQGNNFNYYDMGELPENYQVETEISFSSTGGGQYFIFGSDDKASQGYYVYPANTNNNFWLVLGHKNGSQMRELGRVNISIIDQSMASRFSYENFFVKVTVRKHNDQFYLFFDERPAGQIPYRQFSTGRKIVFKNDINVSVNRSYTSVTLRTTDSKVMVRNFRIAEIIDLVPLD